MEQRRDTCVAKMASHAIFQYNVLAIDDTHNTWTNVIVKMTILRLLGSSDDKEKRGVARPEVGTRFEAFCYHRLNRSLTAFFSSADVNAPTQYSDAPSVEPVLKKLLLYT